MKEMTMTDKARKALESTTLSPMSVLVDTGEEVVGDTRYTRYTFAEKVPGGETLTDVYV